MSRHRLPLAISTGVGLSILLSLPAAHAAVTTDSSYLLVNRERTFLIGTYALPPGISYEDFRGAGFNFLFRSRALSSSVPCPDDLWRAAYVSLSIPPGQPAYPLIEAINELESQPGLIVWHGPDEPAWLDNPIDPVGLAAGHDVIDAYDDYLGSPRPVWINHACRGTRAHPDSFDLLRPYFDCADVFSMDIYPVPESVEHSILPNKTITCVGEHVDILIDLLSDEEGRQQKPAWMVLQAFSWTDFNPTLEWCGLRRSQYDFERIAEAASGDVDGDGLSDLVFLYAEGDSLTSCQRADVALSTGSRFRAPQEWMEAQAESLSWHSVGGLGCGDMTGDGLADLALWVDRADKPGRVWVAASLGSAFDTARVWLNPALPTLDSTSVVGCGLEDVDRDGLDDLVLAILADSSDTQRQILWVARSLGDHLGPLEIWREVPPSEIQFDKVLHFSTGDYTGDGIGDVCFLHDSTGDRIQASVASSDGSAFSPLSTWWDTLSAEFPPENLFGITVQDLDGDGRTDPLLFYVQRLRWLGALLSEGSCFHLECWGGSDLPSSPFDEYRFTLGGDFNGDGLGDFAVVHDYDYPRNDPYQVLDVALSYGEKFGFPGPSLEETRFMAYDAIIHGATGILWWGLLYTGGPYAVWQAVSEVARELSTLGELLVWDDASDAVHAEPPEVEVLLKRREGQYTLIAANRSESPVDATFSGSWIADSGRFTVVFENRTLTAQADTLSDTFGPHEVHVYLGRFPGSPPTMPELSISPNPFGSVTQFGLRAENAGPLSVDIYDVRGRLVRHLLGLPSDSGFHRVTWDGTDSRGLHVPSGIYLCQFRLGGRTYRGKVIRIR